jgi:hypothetical protein
MDLLVGDSPSSAGACRNVPQRMEGDPMGRIATDAARHALDFKSRQTGSAGDAASSAGQGSVWDQMCDDAFWTADPVSKPEPEDAHQAEGVKTRCVVHQLCWLQ